MPARVLRLQRLRGHAHTADDFEKHQCPRGYYDYSEIVFVNQMIILFEKHQCPRGYYDDDELIAAGAAEAQALRSTNAREGITTIPW